MCVPLDAILDPNTGRGFEKSLSLPDSPCFVGGEGPRWLCVNEGATRSISPVGENSLRSRRRSMTETPDRDPPPGALLAYG